MKKIVYPVLSSLFLAVAIFSNCNTNTNSASENDTTAMDTTKKELTEIEKKLNQYIAVELKTDLSVLSKKELEMLPLLIEIADIMNGLFWYEAYGNKNELMKKIDDKAKRKYAEINYGPWDRLDGNKAFIVGIGDKPKGANFYPMNMTEEEFENFDDPDKDSQYTFIRRNQDGTLKTVFYHQFFKEKIEKAAEYLKQAADLAEDEGLKNYLNLRSKALLTDDYFESDMAWMDMKNNTIEFIVGPIENYEDQLFGYKAAHEAFILIKDKNWSKRLEKYAAMLQDLQSQLPVDKKYKKEKPGTSSDLNVYDAIYYAGDCNAGSKTIAINLPNDKRVQLEKGSRKLQLKNAMRAKFDNILVPIANELITDEQQQYVKFDAFFENVMFHEVAHGLGIKNTINGKGAVKEALKETYTTIEEGKADIVGLFLITKLHEQGEIDLDLMNHYVTFMASIFRSIRFGAASSHGKANLIRFNYFKKMGAFTKNSDGKYSVDFEKMKEAVNTLSNLIITIQGDGDYVAANKLIREKAVIRDDLKQSLSQLKEANIPVDIVFKQGLNVIGWKR